MVQIGAALYEAVALRTKFPGYPSTAISKQSLKNQISPTIIHERIRLPMISGEYQ
jgi:hypothetical protein